MARREAAAKTMDFDTLFARQSQDARRMCVDRALSTVQAELTDLQFKSMITSDLDKDIRQHEIEYINKFSLALVCIIFFFIGAPLGAIIRKGGLGLPVVVSIIFFVIYYIISLSGEKLAKEGSWDAVYGMWLSTFILTPIAIYLTYKATNDSALLDTDWYAGKFKALYERMRPAINKLKNAIKLKRNGKKHDSE